jgi:hypothetical protein
MFIHTRPFFLLVSLGVLEPRKSVLDDADDDDEDDVVDVDEDSNRDKVSVVVCFSRSFFPIQRSNVFVFCFFDDE